MISLSTEEKRIYNLVVKRFLACFMGPYKYKQIKAEFECESEKFTAGGKEEVSLGWKAVYSSDYSFDDEDTADAQERKQILPKMKYSDEFICKNTFVKSGKTKPPARYTEATLLSAMENPSRFVNDKNMKEYLGGGLGTPATRADIIEKLYSSFYVEKQGNSMVPTSKGVQLIDLVPPDLKEPLLTAKWEQELEKISKGKTQKQKFIAEIEKYSADLVKTVKNSSAEYKHDNMTKKTCPDCGKYLLEVNGRYDGSSKYMSGDRWGFFPSVSAGWRISEESFFEPARNIFDNLKVRASYGSLGNQVTDGNFQYLSFLTSESLAYLMNGSIISGLKAPTLASTNITWEKVYTTNIGLDWTMLNGRFTGSFDYYIRDTKGMVVNKTYPAVLGTTGGKENLADMRTKGMELSLTWNDQIKDVAGSPLDYSIGIGISDNTSEITKYDNPTLSLDETHYQGKKIGEIWGYVTDGFIKDEAEAQEMANKQAFISTTWKPGDIRYADLNGDGKIDRGNNRVGDSGDKKVIGNTTPRYNFNLNLSGSWKGFDLRLFFQGTMKRDVWLDSPVFWGYKTGIWWANLNDYIIDNSWSETNTNAYYPIPTWSDRSKQTQTKYLQNGAFIRLKDVTLSYTIPKALINKYGIGQLKVFVSGQNLWEATGLYKYLDPDAVGRRDNNGNLKVDDNGSVYPFTRSYSFGINVTF